jgi:hypothetical protein
MKPLPKPEVGELWKYEEGFHYLILKVEKTFRYFPTYTLLLHLETGLTDEYDWPESSMHWERVA